MMIPFTQDYFTKLQQDFDRLTVERGEVMKRLQTAREMGDLSENGAYKYAKFELGDIGRKLRQLSYYLENGQVVPPSKDKSKISFGSLVTVSTGAKEVSYTFVSQYESNPKEGKLSMESPIGAALMGKKTGDKVTVDIPSGTVEYQVLKIA